MATKVTLQITSKNQANKSETTKITYINPALTDAKLKEFGQKLIALTSNTATNYKKISEVDI